MAKPTLNPFSKTTACEACPAGQHGSDVDNDDTSCNQVATTCNAGYGLVGSECTACTNQAKCAASTPNTCSTTSGIATKTPCTSVIATGYYLDGDKVATCATSGNGANAATVTCTTGMDHNATTCNAGYGLVGSACGACAAGTYAVQGNSAACVAIITKADLATAYKAGNCSLADQLDGCDSTQLAEIARHYQSQGQC